MQYPLISEYVKSIQNAGDNLDQLSHLVPVLDTHGEPMRSSGAFAVVFKMLDPGSGKHYALKCFTEEQQGRAEAYRQIAAELEVVDSTYITPVRYLDKELWADTTCADSELPVLLMDWIDGDTMEAYVAAHHADEYAMAMLCHRFCKMAAWLRAQPFAHGDVKPDNIMVRPDGSLTLVDYDGMYVPSMKGQKSPTLGTKDFSHPRRTADDFDEFSDDFALASIALSLKAMSLKPSLYDQYGASDRLLFSAADYLDPAHSQALAAMQQLLPDEELAKFLALFLLAYSQKTLASASFRLFSTTRPPEPEPLSTTVTDNDLANAITDEYGVKYSPDGKRLLKAPRNLKSYTVKPGTQVICDEAFMYIPSNEIEHIVLPKGLVKIGVCAFCGCSLLENINLPNGLESIGAGTFMCCPSIKDITLPYSIKEINENPFSYWQGKLIVKATSFVLEDGLLYNRNKTVLVACVSQEQKVIVPEGIVVIGSSAFNGCELLEEVLLPKGVVSIGSSAFSGCCSLKKIILPDELTYIGSDAFWNCESLENIILPNGLTKVGNSAFSWCSSLNGAEIKRRFGERVLE